MDVMLDLLPSLNRFLLLLGLQVGLLGEFSGGERVALKGQIVQDKSINITVTS